MPKTGFELDTRDFSRSLRRLTQLSRKSAGEELRTAARGFTRKAVDVTPPATGKANTDAKRRGEIMVESDIEKLFVGSTKRRLRGRNPVNIAEYHEATRRRNGRVRAPGHQELVDRRLLRAYIRRKKERVGKLASGWNAAAAKLGVRLPKWITRHGTRFGSIRLDLRGRRLLIEIANRVPYSGDVRGLRRRVAFALRAQEKALLKRIEYALDKAGKKSGFR